MDANAKRQNVKKNTASVTILARSVVNFANAKDAKTVEKEEKEWKKSDNFYMLNE
jgi:hypothetical protein